MNPFPPPPYAQQPDLSAYNEVNQMHGYGLGYNRSPIPRFATPATPNFMSTPASCQDESSFQNYMSPYRMSNPMGSFDGSSESSFADESSGNIEYRDMSNSQPDFQPYTNFRNCSEYPQAPGYYRDPYGMPGYPSEPLPNPSQTVYMGAPVRFPKRFPAAATAGPEAAGNRFRPPKNVPFPKRNFPPGKRPHSNSNVRTQPPPVFYCELCKVSCAGPLAFKDHEAGQRHKKRLSQSQAVERLKQTTGTDGQPTPIVGSGTKELRCQLCDVICTGIDAYNAHTSGKQHQRTLKLHKELGKPIPNTDVPIVETAPANGGEKPKAKNKKQKKGDSEFAALIRDVAPIGVEYVEAVLGNNGKTMHFRCKLCECQFTSSDSKEAHVRGRRHRVQFKKKVDPSFEVSPRPSTVPRKPFVGQKRNAADLSSDMNDFALSIGSLGMFPPRDPNSPFRGPSTFGRFPCAPVFPGRLSAAQIPNAAAENRYISVKHTSLVPTTTEFNAVKSAVNVCERALKEISDKLYEETCSSAPKEHTATKSQPTKPAETTNPDKSDADAPDDGDVKKDESEQDETPEPADPETQSPNQQFAEGEYRLLSGVIRVGPLGKGLMLKGEHTADLALVCSYWPTVELLNFVASKLATNMKCLESRLTYTVTPEPSMGRIAVTAMCPDPGAMRPTNDTDQNGTPKSSASAPATTGTTAAAPAPTTVNTTLNTPSSSTDLPAWPEITINLYLTSPAVIDRSSGSEESGKGSNSNGTSDDQSKGPHMHALIANGRPLDLQNCLKTLDMINQTKWFQAVGNKGPMRIVCRILRDYLQSNDHWIEMDESAVFDHLERLLNTEWYFSYRAGQMPRPFNPCGGPSHPGVVPRVPPSYSTAFKNVTGSANSYLSPCVLMRRFFESIASGLLLLMEPDVETQPTDDSMTGDNPATPARKPSTIDFPDNRPQFIPTSLVSGLSLATREKITASAQQAVRMVAFKQLHKILGMQPFVPQAVLLAQSKIDDSEPDQTDAKRPRLETPNGNTTTTTTNGETTQSPGVNAKPELAADTAPDSSTKTEESSRRVTRHSATSRR